jgi:hypothetical protein
MRIIKIFLISIFFAQCLTGCGTFSEAGKALRNQKRVTTDEFQIRKRDPLTQPPNYESIPRPGEKASAQTEEDFKKILSSETSDSEKTKSSSTTEKSIIEKIKK